MDSSYSSFAGIWIEVHHKCWGASKKIQFEKHGDYDDELKISHFWQIWKGSECWQRPGSAWNHHCTLRICAHVLHQGRFLFLLLVHYFFYIWYCWGKSLYIIQWIIYKCTGKQVSRDEKVWLCQGERILLSSFSILIKQDKSTKQAICVTTLGKLSPLCGQRREFGIEREIGSNSSTKSHPTDIQLAQYSFITGRMERHTKTVICNRKHLTSVKTKEASVLGYLKLTVFLASRERGKIKRKEKEEFLSRPLSQVACQLSATCTTLDL